MPVSHNGIARGSNPRPFEASPFDSGYRRKLRIEIRFRKSLLLTRGSRPAKGSRNLKSYATR